MVKNERVVYHFVFLLLFVVANMIGWIFGSSRYLVFPDFLMMILAFIVFVVFVIVIMQVEGYYKYIRINRFTKWTKENKVEIADCFGCKRADRECVAFNLLDDWIEYTVYLCQSCINKAKFSTFEMEVDYKCPVCDSQLTFLQREKVLAPDPKASYDGKRWHELSAKDLIKLIEDMDSPKASKMIMSFSNRELIERDVQRFGRIVTRAYIVYLAHEWDCDCHVCSVITAIRLHPGYGD